MRNQEKVEICFADAQTTVFAFQATARHPGAQYLAAGLESLLVRRCLWRKGSERGASQPSTGLFSMHCGCHAAGGAAVVFIVSTRAAGRAEGAKPGGCGGQPGVLFGLATLVPRARSTRAVLPHRISACWTPSTQSRIRGGGKGKHSLPAFLSYSTRRSRRLFCVLRVSLTVPLKRKSPRMSCLSLLFWVFFLLSYCRNIFLPARLSIDIRDNGRLEAETSPPEGPPLPPSGSRARSVCERSHVSVATEAAELAKPALPLPVPRSLQRTELKPGGARG